MPEAGSGATAGVPATVTAPAVGKAAPTAAGAGAGATATAAASGEKKYVGAGGDKVEEMTSADYYFDSYSHFGIHEEMLKDDVRTKAYQNAIMQNKHLFKGKTVMDVGCGTGILCLFAAKAGAKKVIGVDCSSIAVQAKEIVRVNGFADTIEIVQGKVEEITLPDGIEKVDIIISEWMGYFLFYESMLDTVLVARDKWLREGGLLFPDKATLYVSALEDGEYKEEKISFWDNVYGFDFSCIKKLALIEPLVDTVEESALVANTAPLFSIDLNTVTKEELAFSAPFQIQFTRNDFCHAIVAYFDVSFTACHKKVTFSTGPRARYTHWKQTVFYTHDVIAVNEGEIMEGELKCTPNAKNPRDLDIEISYSFEGASGKYDYTQEYRLR